MYSATRPAGNQSPSHRDGTVSGRYQGPKAYKEAFAEIAAKPPISQKAVRGDPVCRIPGQHCGWLDRGTCFRKASRLGIRAYEARLGQSDGLSLATAQQRGRSGSPGPRAQCRSCSPQHGTNAQRYPRRAWPPSVAEKRGRRRFWGDLPGGEVHCLAAARAPSEIRIDTLAPTRLSPVSLAVDNDATVTAAPQRTHTSLTAACSRHPVGKLLVLCDYRRRESSRQRVCAKTSRLRQPTVRGCRASETLHRFCAFSHALCAGKT